MENLIKELLQKSVRPAIIQTDKGPMIYSDKDQAYQMLLNPTYLKCYSFDSFKEAVLANVSAAMTGFSVLFSREKVVLLNPSQEATQYLSWGREFSDQFKVVKEQVGRLYEHIGFMRVLESLRPSIKDLKSVQKRFESVFLSKGETVKSTVSKISSSKDQPSTTIGAFEVSMPVFFGTSQKTTFTIEVDSRLSGLNIQLGLIVPAGESIETNAINDLFETFHKDMKKLRPKLLVLR